MTTEQLEALRFLAKSGDRDAELTIQAGNLEDLIDSYDGLLRMLDLANQLAIAYGSIADLAKTIGRHWRDQEGVSGSLLDELARLTKP